MKSMAKVFMVLALGAVILMPGMAMALTYSGIDFSTMASAGGTYVPGSPGYEHLAYSSPEVDAVVGVRGPLGTLNSLSMSFQYSNLITSGHDVPFAAFGISENGLWDGSGNQFSIISLGGNQLNGATDIHVWDYQTNAEYLPTLWGSTLTSILGITPSDGTMAFGDMQVMRAYAYIGDQGASSGSVNINSITVSSVPLPPSALLLGSGLLGLVGLGWRRRKANA